MLWSQCCANWRRRNVCRRRKCRQLCDGMGIEFKQKQSAAPSSRGEKVICLPIPLSLQPPSEMRLAWSKAARLYFGLLLCSWTLWTSRLFVFLKWCKASRPQRTTRSRSVESLMAMLFRAALRSLSPTSTTAAQKRIAFCGQVLFRDRIWASRSARVWRTSALHDERAVSELARSLFRYHRELWRCR